MKKNTKIIIVAIAVLALFGVGGGVYLNRSQSNQTAQTAAIESKVINYDGVEGKTAYDLLKSNYQVDASESSFGVMVNSINGLKSTSKEFWLYSVNGQQPDVAADKYVTHQGDRVTWEYKGM